MNIIQIFLAIISSVSFVYSAQAADFEYQCVPKSTNSTIAHISINMTSDAKYFLSQVNHQGKKLKFEVEYDDDVDSIYYYSETYKRTLWIDARVDASVKEGIEGGYIVYLNGPASKVEVSMICSRP